MIHNNGTPLPNLLQILAGEASNTSKDAMARTATTDTETPTRKPHKTSQRKQVGNGRAATPRQPRQPTVPPDQFGFRSGSLKSQAATMYASKKGATLAEVKAALNSSQFNLLTELEARKGITIERTQVEGTGPRKVTRYRILVAK